MYDAKRVLVVGSDRTPQICADLLKPRFETRHAQIDALNTSDLHWSEFILAIEGKHRRLIAQRFPQEYLLRRVVSLNLDTVPEKRGEQTIRELLISHDLIPSE